MADVRLAVARLAGAPLTDGLARDRLFGGRLEELTPELPDPADWVRHGLQGYDPGARRGLNDCHLRLGNSLRVDSDHAEMNAAFLDHQGPDFGIPFETARARDLQPAHCDDFAADETCDSHLLASDVRLDVGLRTDQQVAVTLDLAAEIAQNLASALEL